MDVNGTPYRTIWLADDGWAVEIIDQTKVPHAFVTLRLETKRDAATAIADMWVRGAPLIGATAASGVYLGRRDDPSDEGVESAWRMLLATRPTGANLRWALDRVRGAVAPLPPADRAQTVTGSRHGWPHEVGTQPRGWSIPSVPVRPGRSVHVPGAPPCRR